MKNELRKILSCVIIVLSAFSRLFCAAGCAAKDELDMVSKANRFIKEHREEVNGRFRGEYHLSPEIGWMNDPNGFVYYKGKYHMFFQYHPLSATNGVMYWGHAVSEDLIKWEHAGVALAPDKEYDQDGCWSGSAVVSGDRLYLIYTGHYDRNGNRIQTQNLAWSDDGVSFEKYEGNPVIGEKHLPEGTSVADFRDPYIWKANGKYFVLIGTMEAGAAKVQLYESEDIFNWSFKSDFLSRADAGFCWECPSVLGLGDADIFICSPVDYPHGEYDFWNYNSAVYSLGNIDYRSGKFLNAGEFREIDAGLDFYAAQLIYGKDGGAVMSAWMNMWGRSYVSAEQGDGWSGSLILPREITLKNGRLYQMPVSAIDNYCKNTVTVKDNLSGERSYAGVEGRAVRLKVKADLSAARSLTVSVFADGTYHTDLICDKEKKLVTFDRTFSGYKVGADPRDLSEGRIRRLAYPFESGRIELDIFLDKSSAEIFIGGGECSMTSLTFTDENAKGIVFSAQGSVGLEIEKSDIIV